MTSYRRPRRWHEHISWWRVGFFLAFVVALWTDSAMVMVGYCIALTFEVFDLLSKKAPPSGSATTPADPSPSGRGGEDV